MILTIKPRKMALYIANGKYSASQVKNLTGADIVFNGTLYTFATMKPCLDFKADGVVYSDEEPLYEGYGWNKDSRYMARTTDMQKYDNFISSCNIIKGGKACSVDGIAWVAGSRPRTAIGWKANSEMVIYVTNYNKTIAEVTSEMLKAGCVDAINLDGGGSTQIATTNYGSIFPAGGRKVQNYICIWEKETEQAPTSPQTSEPASNWSITPLGVTKFPLVVRAERKLNMRALPTSASSLVTVIPKSKEISVTGYALNKQWLKTNEGYVYRLYTECQNPYTPPKLSIQKSSSGEGVRWMQWQLGRKKYKGQDSNILGCDGSFGPNTQYALMCFQKDNGLKVNGICDAATREKLSK